MAAFFKKEEQGTPVLSGSHNVTIQICRISVLWVSLCKSTYTKSGARMNSSVEIFHQQKKKLHFVVSGNPTMSFSSISERIERGPELSLGSVEGKCTGRLLVLPELSFPGVIFFSLCVISADNVIELKNELLTPVVL